MTSPLPSNPLPRWGLFATAFLLVITLVATAVSGYRGVRDLRDVLINGQIEMHLRTLHAVHQSTDHPLRLAELQRILEVEAPRGLTYVATVFIGEPPIEAGERLGSIDDLAGAGGRQLREVGDGRIQFFHQAGPGGNAAAVPRPWSGGDAPDLPGGERLLPPDGSPTGLASLARDPGISQPPGRKGLGGRGGAVPYTVLEFVPTIADAAERRALGTLLASVVAALALGGAMTVFWRQTQEADAHRVHLERQARLASLGEMSAVMAHEIRNPLASLKGHAQLLAEQLETGSRQRDKIDRVVKEAVRLENLSSGLLDFVRSGEVRREPVDIQEHLLEAIAFMPTVRLHSIDAPRIWPIDRLRFRQVIVNLVQNASQASPAGAPIEVTAVARGRSFIVEVRDHGKGIPPGQEEEIFEAFRTGRTQGTGLGLAVSRRIVELHGGTLTAANHPEGGAVFTVEIPA